MAYKNLYVDSDIILDRLLQRTPFYHYSQLLFQIGENKQAQLNTSTLVIANVNYVLSKSIGKVLAKVGIRDTVERLNILSFEPDAISAALESDFTDFEDSLQHFIAAKYHCDAIITRNIKDYKRSNILVLTAEQYLRTIL